MGEGEILCNGLLINKLLYVGYYFLLSRSQFSQFLLYMFNELKGTIPHRNSETNPPHCQCRLQVSKTKAQCSNSSNMLQN